MKIKVSNRIISFILIMVFMFPFTENIYAYSGKEHDNIMYKMLFGTANSYKNDDRVKILEDASYLAIDQFNGQGQDKLDFLREEKHIDNMPSDISEIDFNYNSQHRSYTHRGWDHIYTKSEEESAHWTKRKLLLCSAVNSVFDFDDEEYSLLKNVVIIKHLPFIKDNAISDKCNSFSAIIYYIHLLGDQKARKSYKKNDLTMDFVHTNSSDDNPDILYEMDKHFDALFSDQSNSRVYIDFKYKIGKIRKNTENIAASKGGINSDEKFTEYQEYLDEYMDLLFDKLPYLLKNESWFKNTFK